MKDQGTTSSAHAARNSLIAQLRNRLIITVSILVCCILLNSAISIAVVMNSATSGDTEVNDLSEYR